MVWFCQNAPSTRSIRWDYKIQLSYCNYIYHLRAHFTYLIKRFSIDSDRLCMCTLQLIQTWQACVQLAGTWFHLAHSGWPEHTQCLPLKRIAVAAADIAMLNLFCAKHYITVRAQTWDVSFSRKYGPGRQCGNVLPQKYRLLKFMLLAIFSLGLWRCYVLEGLPVSLQ